MGLGQENMGWNEIILGFALLGQERLPRPPPPRCVREREEREGLLGDSKGQEGWSGSVGHMVGEEEEGFRVLRCGASAPPPPPEPPTKPLKK